MRGRSGYLRSAFSIVVIFFSSASLKYRRGDFEIFKEEIDSESFVYFDPPYRPISKTASFTSYSGNEFGDEEQMRLSEHFRELDSRGAKLLLSNSDPKNIDPDDDFFESAYKGFNLFRVKANRMISCKGDKRGKINELIITNYEADT